MVPMDRILQTAIDEKADLIGLSGLITPSLDEMVFVAREMSRRGFTIPLLIGGATTSRQHTSVKIAPEFGEPVVHVLDASRAVDVVSNLLSPTQKPAFTAANRAEQDRLRQQHAGLKRRPLRPWAAAQSESSTPDMEQRHGGHAVVHRRPTARRCATRRPRAVHRLDLLLRGVGAEGTVPRNPRSPEPRAPPRASSTTKPASCSIASSPTDCSRHVASTASGPPIPWATTSSSTSRDSGPGTRARAPSARPRDPPLQHAATAGGGVRGNAAPVTGRLHRAPWKPASATFSARSP